MNVLQLKLEAFIEADTDRMGCSVSHPVTKDSRPSDYSYHPQAPRKNTPGFHVNSVTAFATANMATAPSVGKILAISPYSRNRVLQAAALQLSKELLVVQSMRITMQARLSTSCSWQRKLLLANLTSLSVQASCITHENLYLSFDQIHSCHLLASHDSL